MSKKQNGKPAVKAPKELSFKEQLEQLAVLKIEEQAILKRGLQSFLASVDNVVGISNKTVQILKDELKKSE